MKRLGLRVLIAICTFIIGIVAAYFVWLASSEPAEIAPVYLQPDAKVSISSDIPKKSVKEEWEEMARTEGCTLGLNYYHPKYDSYDPQNSVRFEGGVFYSPKWVSFLRKEKGTTVPFLISQIPNKAETNVHIAPFGNATKGELAVYCLQYILKVNWYQLSDNYRVRFDRTINGVANDQAQLQRIIGTKRGAREMMDLWTKVSEQAM